MSEPDKEEKLTPWVIGVFAIVVFALATYMNYGGGFHYSSPPEISAASRAPANASNPGE
jgi:hypothetical protein